MSQQQPQLWVFAGPNRAGKSILVHRSRVAERISVENADDVADALRRGSGPQSEAVIIVHAGWRAVKQLDSLLHESRTFAIKTKLTGRGELELMRATNVGGYKINLVYVKVSSAELSNSRVSLRGAAGGHNVPEPYIFRRFDRSLKNLPAAIKGSDRVWILDDSGKRFILLEVVDRALAFVQYDVGPR